MYFDWLTLLSSAQQAGRVLSLPEQPLAGTGRVLALAPHPDDPDAVAVTLRMLARGGWEVSWAIVTSGWSGVQDAFAGSSHAAKRRCARRSRRHQHAFSAFPRRDCTSCGWSRMRKASWQRRRITARASTPHCGS